MEESSDLLIYGMTLLLGASIGSFLGAVVYRVPRKESLIRPRSRCPSCGKRIASFDNVPIVSWVVLHGRCRNCMGKISVFYPLLEALTAILFVTVVLTQGVGLDLLLKLPFIAVMLAVAVIDLEHRIVPNRIMAAAAIWCTVLSLALWPGEFSAQATAGLIAGGFLLLVALAYPGGMGMGDVKLAAVMGLYLGRAVAPALLIGFALGALVGVAIVLKTGAKGRKQAIPFAPFLAAGGITGLLCGEQLLDWYLGTF